MRSLELLGIRSGSDIKHSKLADRNQFEARRYFDDARILLKSAAEVVFEEIVPNLENHSARWNPGGFMVFPLGLTKDNSSLRLHISPLGMRRDVLNGPFIHNHGWHLASRVIAGEYSDKVVDVKNDQEAKAPDVKNELYRLYETRRLEGGKDLLVTDGTIVKSTIIEERRILSGGFHEIEALTVYHLPTTPPDQFAATLVLDSPAFVNNTHVLLNNDLPIPINRERKSVDREIIILAREQLRRITGR